MHYRATFIVYRETPNGTVRELCSGTQFYAVSTERLLELMREGWVPGLPPDRRYDLPADSYREKGRLIL
jgi:hypothetical protein